MKKNKLIKIFMTIFMFILFCNVQALSVSYNNKESVINNYYNNLSNKEDFIHDNTGLISLEEYEKTLLVASNSASSFIYNKKEFMFNNVVNGKVNVLLSTGNIIKKDLNFNSSIKESVLIKEKVKVLGNGTKANPYIFVRFTPKEYKIKLNIYGINEEIFQQFEKTVPVGGTLAFNVENFEKGFLIKNEDLECENNSLIVFQNNQIIVSYASKNDTCSAKITPSILRVTFNANGGTNDGIKYKDMIYYTTYTGNKTLPYYVNSSDYNIYKSGYTFKGWYTATSGGTQVFNASGQLNANVSGYSDSSRRWLYYTQNITLYAQWTKLTLLSDAIKKDNPEYKTQVVINDTMFQNVATTDMGLWTENRAGKTEGNLPTYFYRGDINNNYVSFAGKMWRIVRINEDGTIKLILGGKTKKDGYGGTTRFSTRFDDIDYSQSTSALRIANEEWYTNDTKGNLDVYESYIATSKFCNDKSLVFKEGVDFYYGAFARVSGYSSDGNFTIQEVSPQYKCPNASDNLMYKIGALTADEVVYAGGLKTIKNTTYYLYDNAQEIGLQGEWWLLSASYIHNDSANVSAVYGKGTGSGSIDYSHVGWTQSFRPVISLKSDTQIFRGNGEIEKPYVITE